MKKTFIAAALLAAMNFLPVWSAGVSPASVWQGNIVVNTPHNSLVLNADEHGNLHFDYFGQLLSEGEVSQLRSSRLALNQWAYPAFGQDDMTDLPAIQVLHADGQWSLYPTVDDVTTTTDQRATTTTITMTDKKYPVTVKVFYKAYSTVDMIETWTEISHREKKAITLKRYDSGHLAIPQGNLYMIHMHGNWSAETTPTVEPVNPGLKIVRNSDGARNAHTDAPEMMFSLDGKPQENSGRVIGAAL